MYMQVCGAQVAQPQPEQGDAQPQLEQGDAQLGYATAYVGL
jgi:hypothetical protein